MSSRQELRRALREADPGREREMSPIERARIRSIVASATRPPSRRVAPLPLVAAGLALATLAIAVFVPRPHATPPAAHITTAPVQPVAPPQIPVVAATPVPVAAVHKAHRRPAAAPVQAAKLAAGEAVTRIVFTGPSGTRILWFVGNPDSKELGS